MGPQPPHTPAPGARPTEDEDRDGSAECTALALYRSAHALPVAEAALVELGAALAGPAQLRAERITYVALLLRAELGPIALPADLQARANRASFQLRTLEQASVTGASFRDVYREILHVLFECARIRRTIADAWARANPVAARANLDRCCRRLAWSRLPASQEVIAYEYGRALRSWARRNAPWLLEEHPSAIADALAHVPAAVKHQHRVRTHGGGLRRASYQQAA